MIYGSTIGAAAIPDLVATALILKHRRQWAESQTRGRPYYLTAVATTTQERDHLLALWFPSHLRYRLVTETVSGVEYFGLFVRGMQP
jgi:hypothetical protein